VLTTIKDFDIWTSDAYNYEIL